MPSRAVQLATHNSTALSVRVRLLGRDVPAELLGAVARASEKSRSSGTKPAPPARRGTGAADSADALGRGIAGKPSVVAGSVSVTYKAPVGDPQGSAEEDDQGGLMWSLPGSTSPRPRSADEPRGGRKGVPALELKKTVDVPAERDGAAAPAPGKRPPAPPGKGGASSSLAADPLAKGGGGGEGAKSADSMRENGNDGYDVSR